MLLLQFQPSLLLPQLAMKNNQDHPQQPVSTTTATTTITTTTKCKRTKPEDATIASMITVEDIQNSEHCLCGFFDPLCVHLQHKGTLPGNNS
jgi:hypothetical protein